MVKIFALGISFSCLALGGAETCEYRITEAAGSWNDALEVCNRSGFVLASVTNDEEQCRAAALIVGFSVWIGGYRNALDRKWAWVDGSPWNYSYWRLSPRESDDHRTQEDAAILGCAGTGQWCDSRSDGPILRGLCGLPCGDAQLPVQANPSCNLLANTTSTSTSTVPFDSDLELDASIYDGVGSAGFRMQACCVLSVTAIALLRW
eukprot:TRINITY_DN112963_c0_g1_i1.p1 TRINITY_DN112963_c0_g1~~TRINITY_DN112963_c0_g1_i1.p1  ORF type:complete len:206 (+),score=18.77 TRINITY_DN112963_c0_g1_i1:31-648(+)